MSTPVLATKLVAPVLRPRLVPRLRLTGRLDDALRDRHRLVLVSAPAGFGKTTVLGAWLAHLRDTEPSCAVAWVSLDEADNDLARLLDHLLAALGKAGLDVAPLSPGPSAAHRARRSPSWSTRSRMPWARHRGSAGSWCSTTSTWSRPPRCTRP